MLPGIVASRTWLSVAGLRPEGFKEYRLGSIFVWSAMSGLTALLNAARLKAALEAAGSGSLEWMPAVLLVGHLLVGPWLAAVLFGLLARHTTWMQRLLGFFGVIRPGSRTPWDELLGNTQSMQVTFSWENATYYGYFAKADTEGTQLYLEDVHFETETGEWQPVPEMTGALILEGGNHVLWLYEPLTTSSKMPTEGSEDSGDVERAMPDSHEQSGEPRAAGPQPKVLKS